MYKYTILCAVIAFWSGVVADTRRTFSKDCFNITGVISFNVTYKMADDKLSSYTVQLSEKANVSDFNCDKTKGPVSATIKDGTNSLVVQFDINPNKSKNAALDPEHWGVTSMTYNYLVSEADAKPQGMRQATAVGSFFVTPINHTYSCSSQSLKLENVTMGSGNDTVKIADEFVLFEETGILVSFGPNQEVDNDYDYHYCKADQKVKDIVPIAVGVALAALVVIVLIAYLIGRRRTVAAGGYERV